MTTIDSDFKQIPLNSEYDVFAEIALTSFYGVEAEGKSKETTDCCICLESLNDRYTMTYPCKTRHKFHRNCILLFVLNENEKSELVSKYDKCPGCMETLVKKLFD